MENNHERRRRGEESNPVRGRDDEHAWRGIRGRGAYADRSQANHVNGPVRIACPITKTDLARILREIEKEPSRKTRS